LSPPALDLLFPPLLPQKLHKHIAGHTRYMFLGFFPDFFLICPATHFVAPE